MSIWAGFEKYIMSTSFFKFQPFWVPVKFVQCPLVWETAVGGPVGMRLSCGEQQEPCNHKTETMWWGSYVQDCHQVSRELRVSTSSEVRYYMYIWHTCMCTEFLIHTPTVLTDRLWQSQTVGRQTPSLANYTSSSHWDIQQYPLTKEMLSLHQRRLDMT